MSLKKDFEQPKTAMVLSAGYGRRLLPLTEKCPKVLLPLFGESLLDAILNHLERQKIQKTVINTFYLAHQIEVHFSQHPRKMPLVFSREEILLDTGGGVKRALPELGKKPFFVINGDTFWKVSASSCLESLVDAWVDDFMDAILLLVPKELAWGYEENPGSFSQNSHGRVFWRGEKAEAPYVFSGVQLVHPRAYEGISDMVFSNRLMWDRLIQRGRLYGAVWEGAWYHVGTLDTYERLQQKVW